MKWQVESMRLLNSLLVKRGGSEGEVKEEKEITIFFQNFNQKFGKVLHKISTNLLSLIHLRNFETNMFRFGTASSTVVQAADFDHGVSGLLLVIRNIWS